MYVCMYVCNYIYIYVFTYFMGFLSTPVNASISSMIYHVTLYNKLKII